MGVKKQLLQSTIIERLAQQILQTLEHAFAITKPMNLFKSHPGGLTFLATLALAPLPLAAKENSAAIDLARQLNQAFIEVADKVSPAVVVIKLAHKPD